jgi:DNA (cytosine-5)-methyltransferase 1
VAWHPLGWKAAWLSEIEAFPSAVLAHHYPDVPNLGDMTTLPERILSGEVEAPDVFCGGTPCQAFSVAGLRNSLDDARGNLSLTFCEIANAIDTVRTGAGQQPAIIFWENVPGVLSTKDNAFGCFLAGLAGEDGELEPSGGKWTNAGVVYGPTRAVAWRVLDAQYFGVAQRRRRVFVVASARDDFDPAAVLFEFDGVRRDIAPSREAGESVAGTFKACASSGGWSNSADHAAAGYMQPVGCEFGPSGGRLTDLNPTLDTRAKDGPIRNQLAGAVMQPMPINTMVALRHEALGEATGFGIGEAGDPAYTLTKGHSHAVAQPIAFHPTQDPISSTDGTTHGLGCGSSGGQASVAVAQPYTLAIRGRGDTHQLEYRQDGTANALLTPNGGRAGIGVGAVAQPIGRGKSDQDPHVLAPVRYGDHQQDTLHHESGIMSTLPGGTNNNAGHYTATVQAMAVRRLTPVECERLQGFPDNYTNIPWSAAKEAARKGISYEAILALRGMTLRGPNLEDCPDGPRYKALGNSWAIPCVAWIGKRIQEAL